MHLRRSSFLIVLSCVVLISLLSVLAVSAAPGVTVTAPSGSGCLLTKPVHSTAHKPIAISEIIDCCTLRLGKLNIGSKYFIPAPCPPPPAPAGICGISYPAGSVVGSLPFETQAYWSPGKPALKVTLNAGTYWVLGVGTAENGDEFYQIVVACQKLYVPVGSMQPSYEPPWSGEELPTAAVE